MDDWTNEQLVEAAQRGYEAQQRLIANTYRLVLDLAGYKPRDPGYSEAIADAVTQVVRAIRTFDPSLGNKFSTYVGGQGRFLRSKLKRSAFVERSRAPLPLEDGWAIPAPVDDSCRFHCVTRAVETIADPRQRFVVEARASGMTLQDVGRLIGVSKERVRQIQISARESLADFRWCERCEPQVERLLYGAWTGRNPKKSLDRRRGVV